MGVHRLPGLETLRFELAPTGSGDVHLRVAVGGADDDAPPSPSAPPTPGGARALPYPLDLADALDSIRAESARARTLEALAERDVSAAAAAASRLIDEGPDGTKASASFDRAALAPAPSKTVVVPTLPPFDPSLVDDPFWAFEPRGGAGEDSAEGEDPGEDFGSRRAEDDDLSNKPSSARFVDDAGWAEADVGEDGLGGGGDRSRRGGGAPDDAAYSFVRGSLAQRPFTPGGAGWAAAAAAAAEARTVAAEAASASWLSEYESGRYAGAPDGFPRSPWTTSEDDAHASPARVEVLEDIAAMDAARGSSLNDDEALLDALRQAEGAGEEEEGTSEEEEEEEEEEDAEEEEASAEEEHAGADATGSASRSLSAVLRSADSAIANARDATKSASRRSDSKKSSDSWAVLDRLRDVDASLRREAPVLAHRFPFPLDAFQKEAVYRLERGESVFVAAHTSAGKTAVAEYAFALATKHCTRVIYTSPIKTISNQKFRDFQRAGFDVGLLTGDVSVRPDAACLIMTTEILRSMLYRGADLIRDVEWVVFDEVHYVNDAERGVVWEEVIIMLPEHVGLVLLSATVPNVWEFADWVGRTKRKKVFVTGTTKRPVPLEHVLYFGGDKDEDFYKIGERETFLPLGYKRALDAMNRAKRRKEGEMATAAQGGGGGGSGPGGRGTGGGAGPGGRGRGGKPSGNAGNKHPGRGGAAGSAFGGHAASGARGRDKNAWVELIRTLERRELLPMVVFCFSRRRCDQMVDSLTGLDLTTSAEKHEIHVFCERCLSRLSPADRKLPQVTRVRELLRRGLGVHHAGLLPIVKEIVEMLFCRGVLKTLFSTETFAMGVNAPARSVCFQDLRKHDGQDFRGLLPGEYTQMAGRAGRRGLDDVGTVIIAAWDAFPSEAQARGLLSGRATKLESQFRLTYGMILNLMRVEDLRVEDMLARSFAEFHAQRSRGNTRGALSLDVAALKRVDELIAAERAADPEGFDAFESRDEASHAAKAVAEEVRALVLGSKGGQAAMTPGRVLLVAGGGEEEGEGEGEGEGERESGRADVGGGALGAGGGDARASFSVSGGMDKHGALLRVVDGNGGGRNGERDASYVVLFPCPEGHPAAAERAREPGGENPASPAAAAASGRAGEVERPGGFLARAKSAGGFGDDDDAFGGGGGGVVLAGGFGKKGARGGFGGSGALGSRADADGRAPAGLPWRLSSGGEDYLVASVPARAILAVTDAKLSADASAILAPPLGPGAPAPAAAAAAARALSEFRRVLGEKNSPAPLHPTRDLKLGDVAAVEACHEHARLVARIPPLPASARSKLREWTALLAARRRLAARVSRAEHDLSDANLRQMPDFEARVEVLRAMGYLDDDRTVTLKGRVACEIAAGDELVGAELIFAGVLAELTAEEAVALLSALVFQEKRASPPDVRGALLEACDRAKALALAAGEAQRERGLPVAPDEYAENALRFGLTEAVHEWARGATFADVCGLTDVQEGAIVRTITRLDEMCRDVRNAARIMGDAALYEKMEAASSAIKRDIVFSASLYVAGAG